MKNGPGIVAIALLAALGLYVNSQGYLRTPTIQRESVAAPPADAPDMVAVFKTNQNKVEARVHAIMAAEFLAAVSNGFKLDADAKVSRIKTLGQAEDVRLLSRTYAILGYKASEKYPDGNGSGFVETIGRFMSQPSRLGEYGAGSVTPDDKEKWNGGAFDSPRRALWIETYRIASEACRKAAKEL